MNRDDSFKKSQPEGIDSSGELATKHSHIKGWAIDADSKNDPTYPIRSRLKGDQLDRPQSRSTPQEHGKEILRSNERPDLSRVFGTSIPPSNLSGSLRRYAFRFSEGRFRHWLMLLLADRINVVEGVVQDVSRGNLPHYLDERGFNAEWKHNRNAVIGRAVAGIVVVGALAYLLSARKDS